MYAHEDARSVRLTCHAAGLARNAGYAVRRSRCAAMRIAQHAAFRSEAMAWHQRRRFAQLRGRFLYRTRSAVHRSCGTAPLDAGDVAAFARPSRVPGFATRSRARQSVPSYAVPPRRLLPDGPALARPSRARQLCYAVPRSPGRHALASFATRSRARQAVPPSPVCHAVPRSPGRHSPRGPALARPSCARQAADRALLSHRPLQLRRPGCTVFHPTRAAGPQFHRRHV